ncbi:hypothetical protein ACFPIF_05190 [Brevundimonas faecalis]|uniref:hypothetical protein n=1 Tax=Brevundimonas faecalis TaxID=947378 RepID=UPI00360D9BE8
MPAIPSERPVFPPAAGGAAHALRTSQSAFFRAAMGIGAPLVAAPVAEAQRDEGQGDTPVRAVGTEEASAVLRHQRPGALLDIRV